MGLAAHRGCGPLAHFVGGDIFLMRSDRPGIAKRVSYRRHEISPEFVFGLPFRSSTRIERALVLGVRILNVKIKLLPGSARPASPR